MHLIVGMSGASGVIYGIRLLEILKSEPEIETHLVMSESAKMNIGLETNWNANDVKKAFIHFIFFKMMREALGPPFFFYLIFKLENLKWKKVKKDSLWLLAKEL